MAELSSLSTTDASNTARWPENMAPSAVNNAGRADEGMLARFYKDISGSLASTGSANAYALAINRTDFAASSTYDGYILAFQANFANTGAATLNVTPSGGSAAGAKTIKKHNDQDLASGDIESGQVVVVCYDNSTDTFQLLSPVANAPLTDPMTTRGDIIVRNSSNVSARLAIGAANRALVSDGTDLGYVAVAILGAVNAFTKSNSVTPVSLTSTSNSIAVDLSLSNNFSHTFTENTTLANPSNAVAGTSGQIAFTQHASSAKTLAFGSQWIEATTGTAPAVSTTTSAQNLMSFYVFDSTHIYYVLNKHGVA
jgi:hypothetical protein